jgi:hypothetical protein
MCINCMHYFSCAVCEAPLDLVLVIDETGYWSGVWQTLIGGINQLIGNLNVGSNLTHIACVTFNSMATLHFNLLQYQTPTDVINAMNTVTNTDGNTVDSQVSRERVFSSSISFGRIISERILIELKRLRGGSGGARGRGRQNRALSSTVPAKGATNITFAPGRQKPWRRHWLVLFRNPI